MTPTQMRKLQRAYGSLLAHDREHGSSVCRDGNEYVDRATALLRSVLGKHRASRVEAKLEKEYSGSGMELEDEE